MRSGVSDNMGVNIYYFIKQPPHPQKKQLGWAQYSPAINIVRADVIKQTRSRQPSLSEDSDDERFGMSKGTRQALHYCVVPHLHTSFHTLDTSTAVIFGTPYALPFIL